MTVITTIVIAALTGTTGFFAGRWDRERARGLATARLLVDRFFAALDVAGLRLQPNRKLRGTDGGKR